MEGLQSIYIITIAGEILVEKHYSPAHSRKEIEPLLFTLEETSTLPPIVDSFGAIFISHIINDICVILSCYPDCPQLFFAATILNLVDYMEKNLKSGLNEASVKTEYTYVYKILDQAFHCGLPFVMESNALSSVIMQCDQRLSIDPKFPYRGVNAQRSHSDLFVTVIENIEARFNSAGKSDLLFIRGEINLKTKLPGQPIVSLLYSIPHIIDDFAFHTCVDPSQFNSRRLTFVPPDGEFQLMSYHSRPDFTCFPIFIEPRFTWGKMGLIFDLDVNITPIDFKPLTNIEITFTLPSQIQTPSLAVSCGSVSYQLQSQVVRWEIETTTQPMRASMNGSASILDSGPTEEIAVFASYTISGFAASGIKIESIDVESAPAKLSKNIRYASKTKSIFF